PSRRRHAGKADPGSNPGSDQREHRPGSADSEGDRIRQRNEIVISMQSSGAARWPAGPPHTNGSAVMDASSDPVLIARGIEKTFESTHALVQAGIELRAGEVHGLLGANGAGKSTLSKVISGHVIRDSGEITYKGRSLDHRSTREALDAGIAIVMQEMSLAPDLSVLENIFLPELGRPGLL